MHECPKNDLLLGKIAPLGANCALLVQIVPSWHKLHPLGANCTLLVQIAPSWCKLWQFQNQVQYGVWNAKKHLQTVQLFVVVHNAKKVLYFTMVHHQTWSNSTMGSQIQAAAGSKI